MTRGPDHPAMRSMPLAAFVHICPECVRKTVNQEIVGRWALGFCSVAWYVLSSCMGDQNHRATKGTKDRMK
jgi:ribosomal protein L37AE/L43A